MNNLFSIEVLDRDANRIPGAFCPHCELTGGVLLDRYKGQQDLLAPCPGCNLGMVRNHQTHGDPNRRFWSVNNVDGLTWNGGKTLDHRWCGKCEGLQLKGHRCEPAREIPKLPDSIGVMPQYDKDDGRET